LGGGIPGRADLEVAVLVLRHTHSHTLALSLTPTHTHTHSHSHTLTLTPTPTHTHTHAHTPGGAYQDAPTWKSPFSYCAANAGVDHVAFPSLPLYLRKCKFD